MQNTRTIKKADQTESWYLIDATGVRLGRLAVAVAQLLNGKHLTDTRAYLVPKVKVVIINAEKVDVHPTKVTGKVYTRYSGYPGGLTKETLGELKDRSPLKVVEHAIWGMLPKNKRGKKIYGSNLYIYPGAEHKHTAQKFNDIDIRNTKI